MGKSTKKDGIVGSVIPDQSIPLDQAREAFGKRAIRFADIGNYHWCITPVIKHEVKKKWLTDESMLVDVKIKRQPMTLFTLEVRRLERSETGDMAPKAYGGCYPMPFYTFDNNLTNAGFEPRDVALAVWQMRKMWGATIQVNLMTDEEVDDYYKIRSSREFIEAREAMADPGKIQEAIASAEKRVVPLPEMEPA